MLRRTTFSGIAAGAIVALGVWALARTTVVAEDTSPAGLNKTSGSPAPAIQANDEKSSGERLLAQASSTAPLAGSQTPQRREVSRDPIVIPLGHLKLIDEEDVPSQRDGVLMFIGTEIHDGEQVPTYDVVQVQIGEESKRFRRLKEGDFVQADQLLALVDDTLARAEEASKRAKLNAAKADKVASEKIRDEAKERWITQQKLYGPIGARLPATTLEDLRMSRVTYEKYVEEAVSKEQAIEVAKQELNQALKTVSMYEIRPKISGIVKAINKHRGEAVKSLEPLLRIQNYDRLRVDAMLPEQYANRLEKGMGVFIEPTLRESPRQTLVGHRNVVTGVAVSKDLTKPLIVSCSDDRSVRVWDVLSGEKRVLKSPDQPQPVRAVACTPPGASVNLCLAGDLQGNAYLWDLNNLAGEPRKLNGHHERAIECVGFSPDGKTCATGGFQQIMVWDTATGNLRFMVPGHRNQVTALHFAPGERLISISRDPIHSVRIWELSGDQPKEAKAGTIERRQFTVDNLGVSPDGQHMMDEHSGEMRVVSVPESQNPVPKTEAILPNPIYGKRFINFALFSPDGKLALTTTETGGVVSVIQLWRLDFNQGRSYELRQFVSPLSVFAKNAAFAPDGSFVAAAVSDRIFVWPVPGKDEFDPIPATITNIEKPIENVQNQVKVTAEIVTAEIGTLGQRLRPGDEATVVAYPKK